MPNMQQTMLLLELEAAGKKPSGPGQHEGCSCGHEGWQHATSGKCNVIGCECAQHDGGKAKMKAGGPGSGRHPWGASRGMHQELIYQGFTKKSEGRYRNSSGSSVKVGGKHGSDWVHRDPKGSKFTGNGPADFRSHYVFE